jgi:molybdopterin-guanine dinucleotide biosynthesis protein A
MDQIEAFILAGGASSRMGTDKSQLLIKEKTFTQHIANTLFQVTDSVTVIGHDVDDRRLKVAKDVYPGWGALGGLHAALNACTTQWAIIIACDLPFVTPSLFAQLDNKRKEQECEAVVPIQADKRPQPLCALYSVNPCLRLAGDLIESGKRRPLDLIQRVNTRWVAYSELEELEQSDKFFVNINTPEDYYEATRAVLDDRGLS